MPQNATLAIYTHSMRRTHDDSADKIAALAGLSAPLADLGNNRLRRTSGSERLPAESRYLHAGSLTLADAA
jgi:hypothetical protein